MATAMCVVASSSDRLHGSAPIHVSRVPVVGHPQTRHHMLCAWLPAAAAGCTVLPPSLWPTTQAQACTGIAVFKLLCWLLFWLPIFILLRLGLSTFVNVALGCSTLITLTIDLAPPGLTAAGQLACPTPKIGPPKVVPNESPCWAVHAGIFVFTQDQIFQKLLHFSLCSTKVLHFFNF